MMNLSSLFKAKLLIILGLVAALAALGLSVCGYSYMVYGPLALMAALFMGGALWFLYKVQTEIRRMTRACQTLKKGQFETRIMGITEHGSLGQAQWALNEFVDVVDAFVRESAAAMEHVSRKKYFRRILEDGMQGSILSGTRIINRATDEVEKNMNGFITIANDFDHSLGEVVQQVNTTVHELETTAATMRDMASLARTGADNVVQTAQNMSGDVQTISSGAEEMSYSIAEITQQMAKTSDMAGKAVSESSEAQEIVKELTEMTSKIRDVVGMISDIAEQTNLLALNATIEAARAGEAGKGFAVVAGEVKDLAGQTGNATGEITELVKSIQESTEKAVHAFGSIGEVIEEVNQAAATVAAAIEEQSAASKEIASSAEHASEGTKGVVDNVKEMQGSISKVDGAAVQVVDVTGVLSKETTARVQELLDKMGLFIEELKKTA